ncbi:ATP-dependent Clp protease proteolytic subunit [Candidatus Sumerlaeota bacterium]|nr:ATP-dependent Clp protease proteolytic subunit [Candidatus Sumerlaeota bacterium]
MTGASKSRNVFRTILVSLCLCASFAQAKEDVSPAGHRVNEFTTRTLESGETYKVYRIDLREEIMSEDVPFFIHRALVAAKAANADVIVIDMNTPGGRGDLMVEIRDDLIQMKIPVYTYVNDWAVSAGSLVAISTDRIVMSPHSIIGGAQVISGGGQALNEAVDQKMTSILQAEARSTAIYKRHPVRICEAFFDRNISIDGLTTAGMVLTMDQRQATQFAGALDPSDPKSATTTLASFIAEDMDDLLKHDGIWPVQVVSYELTWSEVLAKWLLKFRGVLLLIGLGALFIELKTPGIGVPGAIGVVALALFFWGNYVADLSGIIEIVMMVLGLFLLALEIFIIPGFGVAGVTGIFLILSSLIMAMVKLPPPDLPDVGFNMAMLGGALWTIIWVFAAFFPLAWVLSKILPHTGVYRTLVLNPERAARAGQSAAERVRAGTAEMSAKTEDLLGKTGEAMTDLRPAGTAVVAGRRLDVVTEGEYIARGAKIRIVRVLGNVYTVEEHRT